MSDIYARDFTGILAALRVNADLLHRVERLIDQEPMIGKAVEGGGRLSAFRSILRNLIGGQIDLQEAFLRTGLQLPRVNSPYSRSNLVFSQDWEERLVRAELSRFYNQAVMEKLLAEGHTECFVPPSKIQDPSSRCTRELAGSKHNLLTLYDRLVRCYRDNDRSDEDPKVPDHPYCSHTVVPSQ
jgi:hypothetical protein